MTPRRHCGDYAAGMAEPIQVRLFSDYCDDLVIWAPHPTSYDDLGLPQELVIDLKAWDATYYAGLENHEWRNEQTRLAYVEQGRALARRLAGELGDDFVVTVDGGEQFRSRHPARCETAAAALRAHEQVRQAEP